jgi:hypothetical protein
MTPVLATPIVRVFGVAIPRTPSFVSLLFQSKSDLMLLLFQPLLGLAS